jgi:hypothetical protein
LLAPRRSIMNRFVFRRQAICFAFRLPDPSSPRRYRFEAAYSRASSEIVNCFFSFSIYFVSGALPQEARIIGGRFLPSIPNRSIFLLHLQAGNFSLADLTHDCSPFCQHQASISDFFTIKANRALLDHAETFGGARNQPSILECICDRYTVFGLQQALGNVVRQRPLLKAIYEILPRLFRQRI